MKKEWPEKGDKLTFKGVPQFYYPMFLDMKERAEKLLVVGQEYTVSKCEVYSSWCAVELEEVSGEKNYFNFGFFDHEKYGR